MLVRVYLCLYLDPVQVRVVGLVRVYLYLCLDPVQVLAYPWVV